jgi:DNA-binding NarL/FixJ family response regulator
MIVEDSPPMQRILADMVQTCPGLELVSIADCEVDSMAGIKKHLPTLVILDLALSVGNGINILSEIKRQKLDCRVLVFTGYDAEQYRLRCIEAGADWFFSKNRQRREMIEALRKVGAEALTAGKNAPANQRPNTKPNT